jgi:hypothetical protein
MCSRKSSNMPMERSDWPSNFTWRAKSVQMEENFAAQRGMAKRYQTITKSSTND